MANATEAVLGIVPVAVAAGVATNVLASLKDKKRGRGKSLDFFS